MHRPLSIGTGIGAGTSFGTGTIWAVAMARLAALRGACKMGEVNAPEGGGAGVRALSWCASSASRCAGGHCFTPVEMQRCLCSSGSLAPAVPLTVRCTCMVTLTASETKRRVRVGGRVTSGSRPLDEARSAERRVCCVDRRAAAPRASVEVQRSRAANSAAAGVCGLAVDICGRVGVAGVANGQGSC